MTHTKRMFRIAVFTLCTLFSYYAGKAQAFDPSAWQSWKQDLKAEVIKKGISPQGAGEIIDNLSFDPSVLEKDVNQPSKRYTYPEYKAKSITQARIDNGRAFYQRHREEIDHFAAQYGVDGPTIVALLGMETDYGGYTGTFDVLNSLASLAYGAVRDDPQKQRDRRNYFRSQIYYAIKMLDEGIVERANFKGSWAGAFGINQHMPESFFQYVVDGDGDGDLEILNKNDLSDVFATTAKHLQKVGWKSGYRWGREVKVPSNIPDSLIEDKTRKTLAQWRDMGVTLPDGSPIPVVPGMTAALVVPRGERAFLAYDNFFAFRRWNNSDYFALATGELADAIAGVD